MDTKINVGIEALDAVTGGFKKGQLIILGGRPAMGKSVLSLHMMHVMAKRQSLGSIMFTYEYIHQPKVLNSLYCINQKEKELIKFVDLMELGTDGIIKECKKAKGTYEVVIIDYLQLLQEKNMSGAEWMYNALKKLKNMATELNCVVIVISQLMRTVESREDHHPVMSDMPSLGPFGKIEDYSDGVFFLYRDNYYNKVKQGGGLGKTDLILVKYENLEPRNIELPFFMDFFKTPPDINIEAENVYLRIKRLRTDKRMTQQELADRINVSSKTISKWESGRGVPNIESLKAISKFFSVSIDELLSGEEILKIADEDNKQKEKHTRDLVFGLLDCSLIMFLFLPFFGQKGDEIIKEVSLLSLTGTPQYIKIPYLIIVFGIVLTGVLLLALQNYEAVFWLKHKHQISIVLSTVATIEFMITLQPYAAFFTFVFLAIKSLMLIKWR